MIMKVVIFVMQISSSLVLYSGVMPALDDDRINKLPH
jgi:hypothetical protein